MKRLQLFANIAICTAALAGLFSACSSIPESVPTDLTDREIVQRAQTAYDTGHIKAAQYYYDVLLKRYGMNTAIYIEGRYELAHIAIKKKKYEQAVPILQEIIELYAASAPGSLPGEYRKLAELDLAKVPAEKLSSIKKRQEQRRAAIEAEEILEEPEEESEEILEEPEEESEPPEDGQEEES
ncbi:MAG: hypothetical protein J1D88_09725 [Treponema sp.]|nr:hypothetical protein [Treponema sp.]